MKPWQQAADTVLSARTQRLATEPLDSVLGVTLTRAEWMHLLDPLPSPAGIAKLRAYCRERRIKTVADLYHRGFDALLDAPRFGEVTLWVTLVLFDQAGLSVQAFVAQADRSFGALRGQQRMKARAKRRRPRAA